MADIIAKLPVVALRNIVAFPGMVFNLDVGRPKSMCAVKAAMSGYGQRVLLVAQRNNSEEDPDFKDVYDVGTIGIVKQVVRLPRGNMRLLVEVQGRVHLDALGVATDAEHNLYWVAHYSLLASFVPDDKSPAELEAARDLLLESFTRWADASHRVEQEVISSLKQNHDPGQVSDVLAGLVDFTSVEKQELLETLNISERLRVLYSKLSQKLEIAALQQHIKEEVQAAIDKNQREYYLREQLKAIGKELGENGENQAELHEIRERMKQVELSQEATDALNKELERLAMTPRTSPEAAVIRNYVDAVLELPWGKVEPDNFEIQEAERVLNEDHYGLEKVKERILEFLAVRKLTNHSNKGPILCLVGPPGVGKTSLATSIARAMGRKFTRFSLGGISDESEIRGHRRTYIGAMPGRIIRGMQLAGCMNPVFLLDEVDKMHVSGFHGDPAAALMEVLDPEQNNTFSDTFVEIPFDLSKVFWIVTANTMETLPIPLQDRMEIINLSSYTEEEKLQIAQLHLLPRELKENGLTNKLLKLDEAAMRSIIRGYTREAGVRNLERELARLCRRVAYKIVTEERQTGIRVTQKNLETHMGPVKFLEEDLRAECAVGVVTGLAWTAVGGVPLRVEVVASPGHGHLTLTGRLGDVIKESAQVGYGYVRSRAAELGLKAEDFDKLDLNLHYPEGATPKDGPSAGITMATAMVSALTGRRVKADLAMTGELTLTGRVLAVGGIKEKMLAAYRCGVKTVLMPESDIRYLEEVPPEIRKQMKFVAVRTMDEVLTLALEEKPVGEKPKRAPRKRTSTQGAQAKGTKA